MIAINSGRQEQRGQRRAPAINPAPGRSVARDEEPERDARAASASAGHAQARAAKVRPSSDWTRGVRSSARRAASRSSAASRGTVPGRAWRRPAVRAGSRAGAACGEVRQDQQGDRAQKLLEEQTPSAVLAGRSTRAGAESLVPVDLHDPQRCRSRRTWSGRGTWGRTGICAERALGQVSASTSSDAAGSRPAARAASGCGRALEDRDGVGDQEGPHFTFALVGIGPRCHGVAAVLQRDVEVVGVREGPVDS